MHTLCICTQWYCDCPAFAGWMLQGTHMKYVTISCKPSSQWDSASLIMWAACITLSSNTRAAQEEEEKEEEEEGPSQQHAGQHIRTCVIKLQGGARQHRGTQAATQLDPSLLSPGPQIDAGSTVLGATTPPQTVLCKGALCFKCCAVPCSRVKVQPKG